MTVDVVELNLNVRRRRQRILVGILLRACGRGLVWVWRSARRQAAYRHCPARDTNHASRVEPTTPSQTSIGRNSADTTNALYSCFLESSCSLTYLLTYLLTFVLTYLLSHSDGVPVVASLSARRRARRRRGAPWLARRCTSAQTRATSPLSSIRATRHAPARISPSCARAPCAQRPAVFARPPRYSLSECVLAVRGVATTTAQSSTALSRTL